VKRADENEPERRGCPQIAQISADEFPNLGTSVAKAMEVRRNCSNLWKKLPEKFQALEDFSPPALLEGTSERGREKKEPSEFLGCFAASLLFMLKSTFGIPQVSNERQRLGGRKMILKVSKHWKKWRESFQTLEKHKSADA